MRKLICIILCFLGGAALADDPLPAAVVAFAAVTAPCQGEYVQDTCLVRGLHAQDHNPAEAILHFEMSCAFRLTVDGCYLAAKHYLLDPSLRNLARANSLFSIVCAGREVGSPPYGCKYLGWMYLTGVGAPKDAVRAKELLQQSCFTAFAYPFVDAEGCQLLGEFLIATDDDSEVERAFLAFAMGCLDGVSALCSTAHQIVYAQSLRPGSWVPDCDDDASDSALADLTCTNLPRLAIVADSAVESEARENRELREVIKQRVLYLDEDLKFEGEAN
jgi:hypothetical protein